MASSRRNVLSEHEFSECSIVAETEIGRGGEEIKGITWIVSMGDGNRLEKQEKSISVACPRCKGKHTVNMLLERPTSMGSKEFTPALSQNTNRQLGAILVCPKTRRKFHTAIVLKVEDCWDIRIANVTA